MSVKTIAPIPIDTLKQIFSTEGTEVIIDVDGSRINRNVLLVYITNLGLNIRLNFSTTETYFDCIKAYMKSPMMHKIKQIEIGVMDVLLQYKGYETTTSIDYTAVLEDPEMVPVIERWINIIESLTLYSLRWYNITNRIANYHEQFPIEGSKLLTGINFVNLISYDQFPLLMYGGKKENIIYYRYFFDEAVFQGVNLSTYWSSKENIVFTITQAMQKRDLDPARFDASFNTSVEELNKVL